MQCSMAQCSSNDTDLLSNDDRSRPGRKYIGVVSITSVTCLLSCFRIFCCFLLNTQGNTYHR